MVLLQTIRETAIREVFIVLSVFLFPALTGFAQHLPAPADKYIVHSERSDWRLKGEGVVCCPCSVPCPCRTNGAPSYGHCEATLFLRIREGRYGTVSLNGLQLANTTGSCGMSYQKLAALYFESTTTPQQQAAFMKLMASFFPDKSTEFPYVCAVPMHVQAADGHVFRIIIPGILDMAVDRNWGQAHPPFRPVAALDLFSNAVEYAQNIRYVIHDQGAKLNFDYSRRQANYRTVDLEASQYRSRSMLIQFSDGTGTFNGDQLRMIHEQSLDLPDLQAIREMAIRLTQK